MEHPEVCKMLNCNTLYSTAKKPQSPIIYAAWSTACFGRYIPGRIGCHRQFVRVLVNSCPSSRSKWHCELPFRHRLSMFRLFQAQGVISFLKRCTGAGNGQPAPQGKLRKQSPRVCSACFVPVMQKRQINLLFTFSPYFVVEPV